MTKSHSHHLLVYQITMLCIDRGPVSFVKYLQWSSNVKGQCILRVNLDGRRVFFSTFTGPWNWPLTHYWEGGGGLQNRKITGLKRFVPPSRQGKTF